MIDVPDDAGDDVVVVTVSATTLRIDLRCGVVIVGLVGGSIALSDGLVGVRVLTDLLVNTIIDLLSGVCVDVFAGVDANTVAVTKDDLEFIIMRGSLEDSLPFCC